MFINSSALKHQYWGVSQLPPTLLHQLIANPMHKLVGISRWGIKRGRWDPVLLNPFKLAVLDHLTRILITDRALGKQKPSCSPFPLLQSLTRSR